MILQVMVLKTHSPWRRLSPKIGAIFYRLIPSSGEEADA